ncbi:MAG: glycosyltransferase family 2 protein [Candidatus Glassbacteria bacterium]|nr:glycosyltransferase family 2 protein [Candidatus Glassbacteria bacterium]
MLKISAVVISYNAGRSIRRTLESVRGLCVETLVVDSGSTDSTEAICRELGATFIRKPWEGYSRQKNFAVEQAAAPWVLSLDADEEVSAELAGEIRSLDEHTPYRGFLLPRRNHYFGRVLLHGGQYPDLQLRLFRKDSGRFNDRPLHESVVLDGPVGRLQGALEHYSYPTIADYFEKFHRYTELEAERLFAAGGCRGGAALFADLLARPCWKFIRRYFFKLGFLDGVPGLLAAAFGSFTMLVSHARCWEKRLASSHLSGGPGRTPNPD